MTLGLTVLIPAFRNIPRSEIFRVMAKPLILIELIVFVTVCYLGRHQYQVILVACLLSLWNLLSYLVSNLIDKNIYYFSLPVSAALIFYFNITAAPNISYSVYCVPIVGYCFFMIGPMLYRLVYMAFFILATAASEYIKGEVHYKIALFLVIGSAFCLLFYNALTYLNIVQQQLRKNSSMLSESELNLAALLENTRTSIWSVGLDYRA